MKQVVALGNKPSSSRQEPQIAREAAGAVGKPEDSGNKRKWRYFWAEDDGS